MPENDKIAKLIEDSVANVFEGRIHLLREAVVHEVVEALQPVLNDSSAANARAERAEQALASAEKRAAEAEEAVTVALKKAAQAEAQSAAARKEAAEAEEKLQNSSLTSGSSTSLLNAAVASIFDAAVQSDILKALLDGVSQFSARSALFVMRGGSPNAWQSRGFANESAIKGLVLDGSAGLVGRAVRDREPVSAAATEFDASFIGKHGNPSDGNATVLPLVVRDKVAAVIYADAGTGNGSADGSALQILVRSASSWLELIALRKTASGAAESAVPDTAEPAISAAPSVAAKVEVPAPAAAVVGAEDQEIHKKAKRFAKLLVDEIKLYNQAKVAEGRQNKDLYDRLKEDIDKSRATYDKRYGATAAANAGYFTAEVIRILADNDPSTLGGGFQQ